MTLELQQHLQREMEDALAISEADRKRDAIRTVLIHQSDALIDCQRKTAERVKQLAADVPEMKDDIKEIKGVIEAGRQTFRKIAASALKWILLGGGGAEAIRYIITEGAK